MRGGEEGRREGGEGGGEGRREGGEGGGSTEKGRGTAAQTEESKVIHTLNSGSGSTSGGDGSGKVSFSGAAGDGTWHTDRADTRTCPAPLEGDSPLSPDSSWSSSCMKLFS